jgi:hypothetical protein
MKQPATTDMAGVPHSDILPRDSTGAVMTFGTGGPSAIDPTTRMLLVPFRQAGRQHPMKGSIPCAREPADPQEHGPGTVSGPTSQRCATSLSPRTGESGTN